MGLYQRYASGEHQEGFFLKSSDQSLHDFTTSSRANTAVILPLVNKNWKHIDAHEFSLTRWHKLFEYSIVFHGYDPQGFGNVLAFLYGDNSVRFVTKYGICEFNQLLVSPKSRFWPACENLVPEYRNIESRKVLAISNLKQYSVLVNLKGDFPISRLWDETNAGELASSMDTVMLNEKMLDLLLQLGILQPQWITSTILDVVYNSNESSKIADDNLIVSCVGEQLDQLFDPLLEYSPESLHKSYQTPTNQQPLSENQPLPSSIAPIINELLSVQTNFTMKLIDLIQKFIIPLRIEVLKANAGITKVNQVFPPTIDEITRINCILHESLTRAKPYGYIEILKAFSTILPYFFKAFIRHEANVKGFGVKLKRFHEKNNKIIFENSLINQANFSLPEIESIVVGSLLELPKFKLILQRLVKTIKQDKTHDYDILEIEKHFKASIQVIDAFGEAEITPEIAGRIFTPTGKILTELAFNWPSELQFGWLNRKAVGIFEFINIQPLKLNYNRDVVIIFSDSIVFMTIEDDTYYERYSSTANNDGKQLSVSDILMHSLVNQKPLPHAIPSMRVSHWCGINEVLVSSYDGPNSSNMLRILNISEEGFSCKETTKNAEYAKHYQILDKDTNAEKIIDLVNKARILFKDQPFHLFKSCSNSDGLAFYSSAHESSLYKEEQCKSPFALFLNMNFDDLESFFKSHPHLQVVICAFLLKKNQVQIKALNRTMDFQFEKTIPLEQLQQQLQSILIDNFSLMLNSFNLITQSLMRANKASLRYFVERSHDDSPIMRKASRSAQQLNRKATECNTAKSKDVPPPIIVPTDKRGKTDKSTKTNPKDKANEKRKRKRRSWASILCLPFKKQKEAEDYEQESITPVVVAKHSIELFKGRKSLDSRATIPVEQKQPAPVEDKVEHKPLKKTAAPPEHIEKESIDPKIPRRKSMEVLASVINRKKPTTISKYSSNPELGGSERVSKKSGEFIPKGQKMKYTNLLTTAPALIDDNDNTTTDNESAVIPKISLAPVIMGNSTSDVIYLVPDKQDSIQVPVLDYNSSQSTSPTDTIFESTAKKVPSIHNEPKVKELGQKEVSEKVLRVEPATKKPITGEMSIGRANSTSSSVIHVPIGTLNPQAPKILQKDEPEDDKALKTPIQAQQSSVQKSTKRSIWGKMDEPKKIMQQKQQSVHRPPPKVKSVDDINLVMEEQSISDLALNFEEYYDDGMQNWAIINRDNSSILNTHILLEPVGSFINERNVSTSKRVTSERSNITKNSSIEEIFQDIMERYDNITLADSMESLLPPPPPSKMKKNISKISLTPSEFTTQFEKEIVDIFYTEDVLCDEVMESETTHELSNDNIISSSSIEIIERRILSSSEEEEYYSVPEGPSDHSESENVIILEKSPARSFVSSDGTIIDDSSVAAMDKQLIPPTPPPHQANSRIVSSNSISYLSDYIR
ncbi:uncharacterized protein KQ657_005205 [Scheffersomyces spartinae]|uniref:DH domain-containing protein n=1 Tax=Scheffersomyces spartinae TaxID=45513 RepID=A0A9P7V9Q1_9ASCO|nr:uncharacterized protein KQ657_005205 [Scheffersomyces spartinae]KAG7194006.1 hypothetical protein KQ657_005205 [Scheffersomyces spartinae]